MNKEMEELLKQLNKVRCNYDIAIMTIREQIKTLDENIENMTNVSQEQINEWDSRCRTLKWVMKVFNEDV